MPTYVYETLDPSKRRFEVKQSMKDPALTADPETRRAVRRVISGGYGLMQKAGPASPSGGHACGGGGCGCH